MIFFFLEYQFRVDNVTKECPDVSVAINYGGYCYFDEYPLSFAAVLQQEESVRLLVAKIADRNCQDSNDDIPLHIPLTLTAVKARKKIFDHISQKVRTIYYQYRNVICADYPLDDIDTIGKDESLNDTSSLNIIVRGESADHLDMMNVLIVKLLNEKWRTFIKFKFFQCMIIFTIYFGICLFGLLIRGYYHVPSSCIIHEVINKEENIMKSIIANRIEYSFISVNDPIRVLFLFSCILTLAMLPARFTCLIITNGVFYVFATLPCIP
ncbi:unnamed protein product [Rotaria sp. Silwood2]|nr:unnamed protein product [Rotaria sp. Silwood2]